ncbi:hypothetical protein C7B62_09120 [Pleurocapsa sp. CCALA 161]|nr:hypothetical protein C7B62_09120 [Pleurocapsa sp. CCALA 161]
MNIKGKFLIKILDYDSTTRDKKSGSSMIMIIRLLTKIYFFLSTSLFKKIAFVDLIVIKPQKPQARLLGQTSIF